MTTDNHLKGHKSPAEMVSTHIHVWREALAHLLTNPSYDRAYVEHEQKALADIENACEVQLAERTHPDQTDSTLDATLPTWPELNTLMRSLYSASFDYGNAAGKPGPNPHYLRVHNAQGRLRYALHVILGTEPTDENELAQINHARREDGRPEIRIKGRRS
ncbi:MAG TPA: hypothetical protein VF534_13825 [Paraburkholderia sp.]